MVSNKIILTFVIISKFSQPNIIILNLLILIRIIILVVRSFIAQNLRDWELWQLIFNHLPIFIIKHATWPHGCSSKAISNLFLQILLELNLVVSDLVEFIFTLIIEALNSLRSVCRTYAFIITILISDQLFLFTALVGDLIHHLVNVSLNLQTQSCLDLLVETMLKTKSSR